MLEQFDNDKGSIVINFFGTPSSGKSTGAAYVFSKLKMAGVNAELITEFAKDKVWEENREVFKPENQCYLFGEQFYRMNRCKDKVAVILTDSPLPLSILYNKSGILGEDFNRTVMNCFNSFNNISYVLLRDKPYNPVGRRHTEAQSDAMLTPLLELLHSRNVNFTERYGNIDDYDKIANDIMKLLKK